MTREEKINTLKAIIQECEEYQWQRKETLYEIIKDLEQEPTTKNDSPKYCDRSICLKNATACEKFELKAEGERKNLCGK